MHAQSPLLQEKLASLKEAVLGIDESTKAATDEILSVCEMLQQNGQSDDVALARIFRACAVQDLTNQRVKKILDLLAQIETGEFIAQDELLEGPQRHGSAMSQDDVDNLLNDTD